MSEHSVSRAAIAGLMAAVALLGAGTVDAELVGHWTFNESSGDALDNATNGPPADGTLVNTPVRMNENAREFMRFTQASQQYVDAGDAPKLRLTTNLTVMGWLRATNAAIFGGEPGIGKLYNYGFSYYTGPIYCYAGGGGKNVSASPTLGPWHHVTTTYDNDTLRLYFDGVRVGTNQLGADSIPDNTGIPFYMARKYGSTAANTFFQGDYDDVRVFNEAISSQTIYNIYNGGAPPSPDGLLASWNFNDDYTDTSGHGYDLTVNGGVTLVPGKVRTAAQFNGTDGYLSVTSSDFDNPRTRYSIGAWIKPTGSGSDLGVIGNGYEGMNHDITVHGGHTIYAYCRAGGIQLTAGLVANQDADGWVHVVQTFDGTTQRLYINGTESSSTVRSFVDTGASSTSIQVGKVRDTAVGFWIGLIDEAFFTTEVLTEAEIQETMQGVPPPPRSSVFVIR